MKRSFITFSFAVLAIAGILLTSCKKDVPVPDSSPAVKVDYRLSYIGSFHFFSYQISTSMGQNNSNDTVYYDGTISIIPSTDSLLLIRYRAGNQTTICSGDSIFGAYIKPSLDQSGVLKFPEVRNCSNQSGFSGHFIGHDSLAFNVGSGGLGYQYTQVVRGKRY